MRYILGVVGTKVYDLEKKESVYGVQIDVGQEVYDWLRNHDVEISEKGETIFVQNKIKYVDLGISSS